MSYFSRLTVLVSTSFVKRACTEGPDYANDRKIKDKNTPKIHGEIIFVSFASIKRRSLFYVCNNAARVDTCS